MFIMSILKCKVNVGIFWQLTSFLAPSNQLNLANTKTINISVSIAALSIPKYAVLKRFITDSLKYVELNLLDSKYYWRISKTCNDRNKKKTTFTYIHLFSR